MGTVRTDLIGAGLVVAAFSAVLIAMGFHLCLNDFWAWSFFAARLTPTELSTWHNGFMPPGYALFLKSVGPEREIPAAFLATLLSVGVVVFATARLARHTARRGAAPAAVLLCLLFAPFVVSGLTAGPDVVVVALGSVALLLVSAGKPRGGIVAGLLLGLALLVRGHALLLAIAVLLGLAVTGRRGLASRVAAGVVAGVAIQVVVNLAAGESAWSNAQAFNVYKMVHGMDWHAPVIPDGVSVLGVLRDDPVAFLRAWAGAVLRAGAWLAGPAVAWVHARRHDLSGLERGSLFAVVVGALYVLPVSLGDSPRAIVVVTPLIVAPVAGLVADLRARRIAPANFFLALVIALGLALSVQSARAFLAHNFAQARDFAALEEALAGRGGVRARQVFTDDFDLYFRGLEGRRPLTKGGWGLVGIEGWAQEFPQLPTDDRAAFLESCAAHDVRYLALTRRSRRLGQEFSRFYYDPTAAGLGVLGEYGEFVLLELPASARPNEEARP